MADLLAQAATLSAVEQHAAMPVSDDHWTFCTVARAIWPVRASLAKVRMKGLPAIMGKTGEEREIGANEDEGVRERTHFVVFQDNIVGWEMNYHGPRPEGLFPHLAKFPVTAPAIISGSPRMRILLKDNAIDRLPPGARLTMLRVKVSRSILSSLPADRSPLIDTIRDAFGCGAAETVDLVLSGRPRNRDTFWAGAVDGLRTLFTPSVSRTDLKKVDVVGYDPATLERITFDLLSDKLVQVVKLLPAGGRSRSPSSEEVYTAIEQGYSDRRDELLTAAELIT